MNNDRIKKFGLPSFIRFHDSGDDAGGGGEVSIDSNENDALDDDEVTSTQYSCDGADGADGADGPQITSRKKRARQPAGFLMMTPRGLEPRS